MTENLEHEDVRNKWYET